MATGIDGRRPINPTTLPASTPVASAPRAVMKPKTQADPREQAAPPLDPVAASALAARAKGTSARQDLPATGRQLVKRGEGDGAALYDAVMRLADPKVYFGSPPDPALAAALLLGDKTVGSSRVDLQACKLEYSIVSPK